MMNQRRKTIKIGEAEVDMDEVSYDSIIVDIRGPYTVDEREGGILELNISDTRTVRVGQEILGSRVMSIKRLDKDKYEVKSVEVD